MVTLDDDGNVTDPGTTPYQGGPGLAARRAHSPVDVAGGLEPDWEVLWSRDGGHWGYVPSAVADVDGDGDVELFHTKTTWRNSVHGDVEAELCAFDGATGEVLWTFAPGEHISDNANVALADVNGDGAVEILFGTNRAFYALDADGEVVWRAPQRGEDTEDHEGSAHVADVDGDGTPECFYATADSENEEGYVYLLSGTDGSVEWTDHVDNDQGFRGTGIYDADGDGSYELYAGERYGGLHAWEPDGTARFEDVVDRGGYHTGPVFVDAGDGADLLAGTMNGNVVRVSADGDLLAEASFPDTHGPEGDQVDAGIAVADVDGDDTPEVVASTRTETRLLAADDLSVLATLDNDGHAACSWWADFDGDGDYEFNTSHEDGTGAFVQCYDAAGERVTSLRLGADDETGEAIDYRQLAGQAVADVDGDGDLELAVVDLNDGLYVLAGGN